MGWSFERTLIRLQIERRINRRKRTVSSSHPMEKRSGCKGCKKENGSGKKGASRQPPYPADPMTACAAVAHPAAESHKKSSQGDPGKWSINGIVKGAWREEKKKEATCKKSENKEPVPLRAFCDGRENTGINSADSADLLIEIKKGDSCSPNQETADKGGNRCKIVHPFTYAIDLFITYPDKKISARIH